MVLPTGVQKIEKELSPYQLLQNRPNPFDEATIISVRTNNLKSYQNARIVIRDAQGKLVQEIPIELDQEINEVTYNHGYGKVGVYSYSLVVDGQVLSTKQMIFAN